MAVGEKIELTVTARDSKGASIPNVRYEAKVEREKADPPSPARWRSTTRARKGKGSIYATEKVGEPGNYTVTVVAKRDGQEIGRDTARFLVYQDDRELENPSADLAPGPADRRDHRGRVGHSRAAHGNYIKGLDRSAYTEYVSASEYRVWDNWPFLLIFAAFLTLEWWLQAAWLGLRGPLTMKLHVPAVRELAKRWPSRTDSSTTLLKDDLPP